MYCINTKTQKTFEVLEQTNDGFILSVEGNKKSVKISTFKRWYKIIDDQLKSNSKQTKQIVKQVEAQVEQTEQQKKHFTKRDWHNYYKPYERNSAPLWDAVVEGSDFIVRDGDYTPVMLCKMSKTKTCIVVRQQNGCKRYFTNFAAARKHILHNQDIRTIQAVGKAFDKWLATAKLMK